MRGIFKRVMVCYKPHICAIPARWFEVMLGPMERLQLLSLNQDSRGGTGMSIISGTTWGI